MPSRAELLSALEAADAAFEAGDQAAGDDAREIAGLLAGMPADEPQGSKDLNAGPAKNPDPIRGWAEDTVARGTQAVMGGVHGLGQAARGFGQLAAERGIDPVAVAFRLGGRPIDEFGISESLGADAAEAQAAFDQTKAGQSLVGQASAFVGQYAPSMAGPGGAAKTLFGKIVTGMGQGATAGAVQPVMPGESREANAATGAVGGGILAPVAAAGSRIAKGVSDKIGPRMQEVLSTLEANGVRVHPTKIMEDGWLKSVLGFVSDAPGAAGKKFTEAEAAELTAAAGRKFGAGFPEISKAAIDDAKNALSGRYQQIFNGRDVWLDSTSGRQIVNILKTAAKNTDPTDFNIIKRQVDDILGRGQGSGVMKGEEYQVLRSDLKKLADQYVGSKKVVSDAVLSLRDSLDDSAARALGAIDPKIPSALKQLNKDWANYSVVRDVLNKKAGAGGKVSANALHTRTTPTEGGKTRSTREMRELAEAATAAKSGKPLDRTAARAEVPTSFAGLAMRAATAPFVAAGRLVNSAAGSRYLNRGAGNNANALAKLGERAVGPAGAAIPVQYKRKKKARR